MAAVQATDSFDISGTSVSSLQNFLSGVVDISVRDALEQLRPCCTGLSASVLDDMLTANAWEVAQIDMTCINHDQKLAVRIYTCELPFPVYRWFNEPFYSQVLKASNKHAPLLILRSFCRRIAALSCCGATPHSRRFYCVRQLSSCNNQSFCTMGQLTGHILFSWRICLLIFYAVVAGE